MFARLTNTLPWADLFLPLRGVLNLMPAFWSFDPQPKAQVLLFADKRLRLRLRVKQHFSLATSLLNHLPQTIHHAASRDINRSPGHFEFDGCGFD